MEEVKQEVNPIIDVISHESALVSDLIAVIGEINMFFIAMRLERKVDAVYSQKQSITQAACEKLSEEISNTAIMYRDNFINKVEFAKAISEIIEDYRASKTKAPQLRK